MLDVRRDDEYVDADWEDAEAAGLPIVSRPGYGHDEHAQRDDPVSDP